MEEEEEAAAAVEEVVVGVAEDTKDLRVAQQSAYQRT